MEIISTYNSSTVIISILIGVAASFTTLDLVERAYTSEKYNKIWLLGGSAVMGLGIWSMHFTGMLAMRTSVDMQYGGVETILSLGIAILGSLLSFYLLNLERMKNKMLIISSSVMGLGIISMHYVGMHAMRIEAVIKHDYVIVAYSIFIAVSLSFTAFFIFLNTKREVFSLYHLPLALIMGLGISGFHYTAMSSMTFYEHEEHSARLHSLGWGFTIHSPFILFVIVLTTLLIVGVPHTLSIIDKKKSTEKVKYLAYHDNLTGLCNRFKLTNRLQKILENIGRQPKYQGLAVMFLDLDRFKFVNDTMGHGIGDELLRQVSKRLHDNVRSADMVARQGGDEFIILLEDLTRPQVKEIADRICNSFAQPFLLEEEVLISASIGISLYPDDGVSVDDLIKNADEAMYAVKKHGKNNYGFYIHQEKEMSDRKLLIEHDLKKAIKNQEFELYYQPKIELATDEIYGVEALIRWNHPKLGVMSPIEFIPIAEVTGMILPLGNWVLKEACKQAKQWQDSGIWVQMAVNVSGLQFDDNNFVGKVKNFLSSEKLAPEYLELEITESVMQNINRSSMIIKELKSLGVKISIDDFGTGFSSLSVLSAVSIDAVKIDKSFINEMMVSSQAFALVMTIIDMGKSLDFELVAEGIETEGQLRALIEKGCRYGQGYYYSQPIQKKAIEILLSKSAVRA